MEQTKYPPGPYLIGRCGTTPPLGQKFWLAFLSRRERHGLQIARFGIPWHYYVLRRVYGPSAVIFDARRRTSGL